MSGAPDQVRRLRASTRRLGPMHLSTWAALVPLLASCTTFRIVDAYVLPENVVVATETVKDGTLRYGVEPTTVLSAVGVAGIPAVPTKIEGKPPSNVVLHLWLELSRVHDFRVPKQQCLTTDGSATLCSTRMMVRASALRRDDGKKYPDRRPRWHALQQFATAEWKVISPPAPKESVDAARIYSLYGVEIVPDWDIFRAQFLYEFTCNGECPARLSLDKSSLLSIDGESPLAGNALFRHSKSYDYDPVVAPQ